MKNLYLPRKQVGQAIVEMMICIPLLLLFLAGIVQFAILFTARVQFEHSCGEAARQYCAGLIDKNSLGPVIYENLGPFQKYFDQNSLNVSLQSPSSAAGAVIDKCRNTIQQFPILGKYLFNYDGAEWVVNIKCHPPVFFRLLYPGGINFHTDMVAYRYPG